MKLREFKDLNKDDLLDALGLRTKPSLGGVLLGTLGTFGAGVLVGAGLALLFAPKPGRELRENLRARVRRGETLGTPSGTETSAVY